MATTTKQVNPGFCGIWIPALSPKRRRDPELRARGVAASGRARAMLRPLIVERARKRGWQMPTIRKLFEALDVLMAASRCHGEHDGVPMAPAFELTHPLALALLDKRMPTGLPKRARYVRGKTDDDEKEAQRKRSQQRSADADWRQRVERLDELGVIHYRPGRGLAKHVRTAAPVPSIYALPIVWEKLKTTGRSWIARALDKPREFFASAHWARRDLLWQLLTGAAKPVGTYAKRSALARWLGPVPTPELDTDPPPIPAPAPIAKPAPIAAVELDADELEGLAMLKAARLGIGTVKVPKKTATVELPGVVSVEAQRESAPLLGEEQTSFVSSQASSAPTHGGSGKARASSGSPSSREKPSGDEGNPGEGGPHSKGGSGRKTCDACGVAPADRRDPIRKDAVCDGCAELRGWTPDYIPRV